MFFLIYPIVNVSKNWKANEKDLLGFVLVVFEAASRICWPKS